MYTSTGHFPNDTQTLNPKPQTMYYFYIPFSKCHSNPKP